MINIIAIFKILAVSLILAYAFGMFISADWDIRHWSPECRSVIGSISMLGCLVAIIAHFAARKEERKRVWE
jgi:hypothetical protein